MSWKKVISNSNLIKVETENAVLIKLPKSELRFWHPKRLVHLSGKKKYQMTICYTDDFEFTAFRNGKGRYNFKERIEERKLTVDQWEDYFKDSKLE